MAHLLVGRFYSIPEVPPARGTVSVVLGEDHVRRLEIASAALGLSRSEIVRGAVEDLLVSFERTNDLFNSKEP